MGDFDKPWILYENKKLFSFVFVAILRPLCNHGRESLLRIIKSVHYFYLIFYVVTVAQSEFKPPTN